MPNAFSSLSYHPIGQGSDMAKLRVNGQGNTLCFLVREDKQTGPSVCQTLEELGSLMPSTTKPSYSETPTCKVRAKALVSEQID